MRLCVTGAERQYKRQSTTVLILKDKQITAQSQEQGILKLPCDSLSKVIYVYGLGALQAKRTLLYISA